MFLAFGRVSVDLLSQSGFLVFVLYIAAVGKCIVVEWSSFITGTFPWL